MLNKFFLFLFILLGLEAPVYGASSDHNITEVNLTTKTSMKIHDAELVYILKNSRIVKLEKINGDFFLTGMHQGIAIVQAYKKNGLFETYRIKIKNKESFKNIRQSGNQGYRIYWRNSYLTTTARSSLPYRYSSIFGLKTKAGTYSSFEGNIRHSNYFKTMFNVHYTYKNFKYSYGDLNLKGMHFGTMNVTSPILRQHILSGKFLNKTLTLDVWTGKISPAVVNGTGSRNYAENENNDISKAQISGFNVFYQQPNRKYFLSGITNSLSSYYLTVMGADFISKKNSLFVSVGKTSEGETFDIRASHSFDKEKWTLQKISASYSYSPNGYNSLWFSFPFVSETFNTSLNFYNLNMFNEKGSFFTNLNYSHMLRGVNLTRQVRTNVGWKNKKYSYEVFFSKQNTVDSTLSDPMIYNVYGARVAAEVMDKNDWRIRSTLNYTTGYNLMNDFTSLSKRTRLNLIGAYQKRWILGLTLGHNRLERYNVDRDRIQAGASIKYSRDKVKLNVSHHITFSSLGNQERTIGNVSWSNKNHNLGLRYTFTQDGNRSRNYSTLGLYYTLSFGNDKKSLLKFFDTNKVSGSVFDDSNLNDVKDDNEKGVQGLVVVLTSGNKQEKTLTDKEGHFKFSGLDNGDYKLSIEDSSGLYSLGSFPNDFRLDNTEDYTVVISSRREKTIQYSIKSSIAEYLNAEIWCAEKRVGVVLVKTNENRELKVPMDQNCSIKTTLVSQKNYDYTLFPEVLELTSNTNAYEIQMMVSRKIMGQIFLDKNNNGKFEIGEELFGNIVFDNDIVSSNQNGFFSYLVSDKKNKVIFKGVKKYNCFLNKKEITDFTGKKMLIIPCKK